MTYFYNPSFYYIPSYWNDETAPTGIATIGEVAVNVNTKIDTMDFLNIYWYHFVIMVVLILVIYTINRNR